MRVLMRKLQVDEYLGLVAASSVIRPGVARSGMMREYILRYRFPERREDAHPVMRDIMPDTFGVMVYQEDVIKVAHYFAGLSLAEADVLRRGMSGKFRGREEFERARMRFLSAAGRRAMRNSWPPRCGGRWRVLPDMHLPRGTPLHMLWRVIKAFTSKRIFPWSTWWPQSIMAVGSTALSSICMRRECSALPLRRPV